MSRGPGARSRRRQAAAGGDDPGGPLVGDLRWPDDEPLAGLAGGPVDGDGLPPLAAQIQINGALVLSEAQMDRVLRAVKDRLASEHVGRVDEGLGVGGLAVLLVVAPGHPLPEPFGRKRPGLPVIADRERRKGDLARVMEEFDGLRDISGKVTR